MRKGLVLALAAATLATAASAAPIHKGSSILAIQVYEGDADFVNPEAFDPGYISAYGHSEIGVQVQYWRLLTNAYGLNFTGGIGFFNETNEPGGNAAPTAGDSKYSQSSWQFRVGGDRVVHINDRFHLFVGPGIQVWSGRAKFEDETPPAAEIESENVTRVAISGRIAAHVKMGDSFGLMGQWGHYVGRASAEDAGAKANWWPSGHQGAGGIAFNF